MHRITKSLVDEFKSQLKIAEMSEADLYELYSIFCILKSYYTDETVQALTLEALHTGKGNDWGIDGFIISVTGNMVTNLAELDEVLTSKMRMQVKIGLIQAKTTPHFEVSGMEKLFSGVRNLMADINGDESAVLPPANEKINLLREMLKKIYDHSSKFLNGENPQLTLYYVCEGKYEKNDDQWASESKIAKDVNDSELFSGYKFEPIGQSGLTEINRDIKHSRKVNLKIAQRITLPEVDGIEESYLCLIPFPEFRKLIFDDEGNLRKGLFYDNVRDYQGQNTVNRSMMETIRHGNKSSFAVMNNGITVMATKMSHKGDSFEIRDYQIVNGCQTCNVLAECKNEPGIDDINLVVKLISSEKSEITNSIIVANNSQTEVKQEQLVSLLPIQKQIEDYYNAQTGYKRLYYERRSKQYRYGDSIVNQESIVTIGSQIRSFVSMFLSAPDKVNGYYGSIVEDFKNKGTEVFDEKTQPCYYYLSAYAWYRLSRLLSDGTIAKPFKDFPFHLLLVFRLIAEPYAYKPQDPKHERYCTHICDILNDDAKCSAVFNEASEILKRVLDADNIYGKKTAQSVDFTTAVIKEARKYKSEKSSVNVIPKSDIKDNNFAGEIQPEITKGPKPKLKIIGKIDLSALNSGVRPQKRRKK